MPPCSRPRQLRKNQTLLYRPELVLGRHIPHVLPSSGPSVSCVVDELVCILC